MEILHVDEQLFVVSKPPGLLAQPDHTGDPDVLARAKQWLEERGDDEPFLGLVHRLDRPTSGVMVLGRTSAAARSLSRQFRERTVEKTYLAVVEGTLRGIGSWSDYVAKLGRQPTLVLHDHAEGKPAELDWQALHAAGGRTLLRLQLHTGRPHQIRLQAAERGHPVVGDTRYGAAAAALERDIALHHAYLRLEHPERRRMATFVAPVPEAWDAVVVPKMRSLLEREMDRATLH